MALREADNISYSIRYMTSRQAGKIKKYMATSGEDAECPNLRFPTIYHNKYVLWRDFIFIIFYYILYSQHILIWDGHILATITYIFGRSFLATITFR